MKQRSLHCLVGTNSSCQYAIHVVPATTLWCAFTTFWRNGLSQRWPRLHMWQHEYCVLAIGTDNIVLIVATHMGFSQCGR